MPLSRKRMRERKRLDRSVVKPMSNLAPIKTVKPIPGLVMSGNRIVGITNQPVKPTVAHKPVDMPLLDADGNSVPDYW